MSSVVSSSVTHSSIPAGFAFQEQPTKVVSLDITPTGGPVGMVVGEQGLIHPEAGLASFKGL